MDAFSLFGNVTMVLIWGAVLLLAVVVEIATVQFVSIWFAFSSLICLIIAACGAPVWAQLLVFILATAVLLILTRPVVKRLRGSFVRTNYDMNIGKTAVVTEDIENDFSRGRAVIGGVSWKAVSEDGSVIKSGDTVTVKDVDGAKLVVSKN